MTFDLYFINLNSCRGNYSRKYGNLFVKTFLVFCFEEVLIVFMFLKLGEDKPMGYHSPVEKGLIR